MPCNYIKTINLLLIASLFSGCASKPFDEDRIKVESGYLYVKKSEVTPEIISNIDITDKLEGTADGVAGGLGVCLAPAAAHPAMILFTAICAPFGAAIGAIAGNVTADSADVVAEKELKRNELMSFSNLKTLRVQERIRNSSISYLNAYGIAFSSQDISENILEIAIKEIRLQSVGRQQAFNLTLVAEAKLSNINNKESVQTIPTRYLSPVRSMDKWIDNNYMILDEELKSAYRYIAEQSIEDLILIYHHKQSQKTKGESDKPERDIATNNPSFMGAATSDIRDDLNSENSFSTNIPKLTYAINPVRVDVDVTKDSPSPRTPPNEHVKYPLFEWEELPSSFSEIKTQLKDISYEFRLYRKDESTNTLQGRFSASKLIYEKVNLEEPSHQISQPLKPCVNYLWSVRARFSLNRMTRVTEWSGEYGFGLPPWQARRYYPWYESPMPQNLFYKLQFGTCDD